jgi:hypothetical protein
MKRMGWAAAEGLKGGAESLGSFDAGSRL